MGVNPLSPRENPSPKLKGSIPGGGTLSSPASPVPAPCQACHAQEETKIARRCLRNKMQDTSRDSNKMGRQILSHPRVREYRGQLSLGRTGEGGCSEDNTFEVRVG